MHCEKTTVIKLRIGIRLVLGKKLKVGRNGTKNHFATGKRKYDLFFKIINIIIDDLSS